MKMLLGLQSKGMAKLKVPGQGQMAEADAGVGPGSHSVAMDLELLGLSGSSFPCPQNKDATVVSLLTMAGLFSLLPIVHQGVKIVRCSFQK